MAPSSRPRIVFLFAALSSYVLACWRKLVDLYDAELLVVHRPIDMDAPFAMDVGWIGKRYDRTRISTLGMASIIRDFNPDVIFLSGWSDPGYRKVARAYRKRGVPIVLGLDTQWDGSLKQKLGSATAPLWLHNLADVLWVAGERQSQLARELGYRPPRCWQGVYCCDWERFTRVAEDQPPLSFLYVGRYVESKGIGDLLAAYRAYRETTPDPWPLYCSGSGNLEHAIAVAEGVTDLGFTQPEKLPDILRRYCGVLVLPSRFEPWGVILQEAASAGRPLLCSDACGAAPHLAQQHYNALQFAAGNRGDLTNCLREFSTFTVEKRVAMGQASSLLAGQYTPERWAMTLVEGLAAINGPGKGVAREELVTDREL